MAIKSLPTLQKVEKLQRALHGKAKRSPGFRFYSLYDKVYRADVLEVTYNRCRANGGSAGADGQTFEEIEAYGLRRWLDELAEELRKKDYRPGETVAEMLMASDLTLSSMGRGEVVGKLQFANRVAFQLQTAFSPKRTKADLPQPVVDLEGVQEKRKR